MPMTTVTEEAEGEDENDEEEEKGRQREKVKGRGGEMPSSAPLTPSPSHGLDKDRDGGAGGGGPSSDAVHAKIRSLVMRKPTAEWKEAVRVLFGNGWSAKRGTGMVRTYFIAPKFQDVPRDEVLVKGKSGSDYFTTTAGLKRFATERYGWVGPAPTEKGKEDEKGAGRQIQRAEEKEKEEDERRKRGGQGGSSDRIMTPLQVSALPRTKGITSTPAPIPAPIPANTPVNVYTLPRI